MGTELWDEEWLPTGEPTNRWRGIGASEGKEHRSLKGRGGGHTPSYEPNKARSRIFRALS